MARTSVVLIGLAPTFIDFSSPAYAMFPGLDAATVQAGLDADVAALHQLGYAAELCLVDFGETAEAVLRERFAHNAFDAVMIGAGVRMIAENTPLFEKLINIAHECCGTAKLCFNTGPTDSAEAVKRWFPSSAR